MKISEMHGAERPREKALARGVGALSDGELISIFIRIGRVGESAVDLAQALLSSAGGSLGGVASMGVADLMRVPGIGEAKAVQVAAAFELGRRFVAESFRYEKTPLTSSKQLYFMMLPLLKGLGHEECWVVFLNKALFLLGRERISEGGIDFTSMDVREVLKAALDWKASGVVLVHNHPSGNPRPGRADISETERLRAALSTCDISLLDHVIVADDSFYSFADDALHEIPRGQVIPPCACGR